MNILQIKNFRKVYRNTIAVKNLSIEVKQGSFLGFVGPNGAGKSTTVNYIAGLIRKERGELLVDGEIITEASYRYKSKIGFVLEKPVYIEKLTGEEYLYFAGQMQRLNYAIVKERTAELLEFLEMTHEKDKLINSYSAGLKKKIALAAALIHDPSLLILDEPFEGIDPVSAKAIKDNLKLMVRKGKTVILTSHNLEIVESICTDIAIIKNGEIIYRGTMSGLYEKFADKGKENDTLTLEKIFILCVAPDKKEKRLSWI